MQIAHLAMGAVPLTASLLEKPQCQLTGAQRSCAVRLAASAGASVSRSTGKRFARYSSMMPLDRTLLTVPSAVLSRPHQAILSPQSKRSALSLQMRDVSWRCVGDPGASARPTRAQPSVWPAWTWQ
jgi:hypothetical protein